MKAGIPLLIVLLLTACAASRSELRLASPGGGIPKAPSGMRLAIRTVADARTFANPGAIGANSAVAPNRVVGGKAGGPQEAVLTYGQTVEGVVREHLTAGLRQAGHQVLEGEAATVGAPLGVDVRITEFWSAVSGGFGGTDVKTRIATELKFENGSTLSFGVNNEERKGFARDRAWQESLDKALADYRAQVVLRTASLKPAPPRTTPLPIPVEPAATVTEPEPMDAAPVPTPEPQAP